MTHSMTSAPESRLFSIPLKNLVALLCLLPQEVAAIDAGVVYAVEGDLGFEQQRACLIQRAFGADAREIFLSGIDVGDEQKPYIGTSHKVAGCRDKPGRGRGCFHRSDRGAGSRHRLSTAVMA